MARLLGMLLTIVGVLPTVIAQQKSQEVSSSTPMSNILQETTSIEAFPVSRIFRLTITIDKRVTSSHLEQPSIPLFTSDPKFIVKDGAVHLSIFHDGLLIPVPGGGTSGCFSLNLLQRDEKPRKFFQIFPSLLPQRQDDGK